MISKQVRLIVGVAIMAVASITFADDDPRHERHELMEEVGDAAKAIGGMLKGEREFDAAVLSASLNVFKDVAEQFGDLFPPGSETGMGTEAAPAIWEDRAGFDAALAELIYEVISVL